MKNGKIPQVVTKIEILIKWKWSKNRKDSKLPKVKLKQALYHFNFIAFNYFY